MPDSQNSEQASFPDENGIKEPRIGIVVVAYNHADTLAKVLDRIPREVWEKVSEVVVFDDSSADDTYLVGKGYKVERGADKLTIIRNEKNLGYGGNQKKGYLYCIEKGYDMAVLLHGDGQYAPEIMMNLIEPVEKGEAEAVFGSRMMVPKQARRGGMPLYKYAGNKILTWFENKLLGSDLTEFHSGYRVYNLHALKELPFVRNTDEFHFDTEIIVQLFEKGFRIKEVPISTYYGDEICYVNGMKYAWDVFVTIVQYWMWKRGLRLDARFDMHLESTIYTEKSGYYSSHSIITRICPPGKVLDIGCSGGFVGRKLLDKGCKVTGIDYNGSAPDGYDAYYDFNLNEGLPADLDVSSFSTIVLADVIEHLTEPQKLMEEIANRMAPDAKVILSVPNVANWYVRFSLLFGYFPYSRKGILDNGHLRFYTISSLRKLVRESNFNIRRSFYSVFPFEEFFHGKLELLFTMPYYLLSKVFKGLLAYQTILVLERGTVYDP